MRPNFFWICFATAIIPIGEKLESNLTEMHPPVLTDLKSGERPFILPQMNLPFYSQCSQDKFVYILLYGLMNKQDKGYYLEIGGGDPVNINNSYFFERNLKWKGVSIDIANHFAKAWHSVRSNRLLIQDATKANYKRILKAFPKVIDYLSLDVDGQYDVVLERLPLSDYIFRIITIEHDFYRFGAVYRDKERQILTKMGYHLLCSNVMYIPGLAFEDWWIHPSTFPPNVFSALTSLDLHEKFNADIVQAIQIFIGDNSQN